MSHKEADILDGGEVRARVARHIFEAVSKLAHDRGEQIPVIVRAALSEYIAARLHSGPPLQRQHILDVLRNKPKILQSLLELSESVTAKPVPESLNSPSHSLAHQLLDKAHAVVTPVVSTGASKALKPKRPKRTLPGTKP